MHKKTDFTLKSVFLRFIGDIFAFESAVFPENHPPLFRFKRF
ncbi:hypothetical protein CHCC20335_1534 [Bacillus paralicheniformis]|nr:hypothetical protein CHCC20335_1534 [Bacillus paralicheniformis]